MKPTDDEGYRQRKLALAMAEAVHADQVDKNGEPYFDHCRRVELNLLDLDPQAPFWVRAAALLHDAIEDRDAENALYQAGVEQRVLDLVWTLTRPPGLPYNQYIEDVRAEGRWAILIKLADIKDNTCPSRLSRLDERTRKRLLEKYLQARWLLTNALEELETSHETD